MAYSYTREPLQAQEADKLCQACETMQEKCALTASSCDLIYYYH